MSRQRSDELRVQELAEEVMSSGSTPEEVCRACPELLPHVLQRLALVRGLNAELDALLPRGTPAEPAPWNESAAAAFPSIPGYEVTALLGRGGMGVVYRARHLRLDRDVALKMLLSGEFAGPRELERFSLEARAIAKLSHPNIVQVHDVSERDGRPYFTMELVEGGTLAHWLAGTPQKAERAAELVARIAGAIELAHASGIVHRDLKPANVLLTSDGIPKVSDFGLARRMSGAEDATLSGRIVGTPSYMAPEQIRGSPVGASADVYALGAILYEILTGRPPFRSDSALATQMQVLAKDPVRPSLLNGRVPRDLETICLRCLHKEPGRRYPSAADLASDLHRFLAHEPIHARPVGRLERGFLWSRRNPAKALALSFGAVLLGYAVERAVEGRALAQQKRDQEAVLSPRLDDVFEQLRSGNLAQARSLLAQMPETVSEELQEHVGRARRELSFVEQLEAIRLSRVEITEGRFDRSANRRAADHAYEAAFRAAGFGAVGDDPDVVATRVRDAAVRLALVGALDDWAFCAGDGARADWLLDVARGSDLEPSAWRERLRDPELRLDAETLAELARDVRAQRMTVQLLLGAGERMREADVDVTPLLELVQEENPSDFWANFALSDVLYKEEPGEAIRYAQAAVALRPRASIAHQALGTALRAAGRLDEALEQYRQAVRVEPGFAEAHGRLGLILQLVDDLDGAAVAYREALRINPDLAWVHLNLGLALSDQGRVEEALDGMREAARLEPRSGMAHLSLGNCLESLGRNREAVEAFRRAVEVEPLPTNHHELGSCLARLGRLEEAEAQFQRTIDLEPAHERARSALRLVLVAMGRGMEALASWREAIQARPDDSLAWDGYAELCAYLGLEADHRRACQELIERFGDTDEPRACERIGRACLLLPSESTLPGAMALIDRAGASPLAEAWTRPFIGVASALAEYRSGRFESAIDILRGDAGQALKPLPELIRALALHRLGADVEARRSLGMAALSFDWSPAAAASHDAWIFHVIRREAETLILTELDDLLAGRQEPEDDDTRAALIGACVSVRRDAAAARLYEGLWNDPAASTREQRYLAARTVARAGAGLGLDPADSPERARFRERVRDWLRAELASCVDLFESGEPHRRATALAALHAWLADPAFAALRDPHAMDPLSTAEREDCRALWQQVEDRVRAEE